MKALAIGVSLLFTTLSIASIQVSPFKAELTSPTALSSELLEELTAKIYNCTEKNVVPCTEVEGDKQYQSGIVSEYLGRLEENGETASFDYILSTELSLLLLEGIELLSTQSSFCKMYPKGPGCDSSS